MAVKAFPFEKLDKNIENVYEAVMIAAKRARQINQEQMALVRPALEPEDTAAEEPVAVNELEPEVDLEKLPKPVASALDELLNQKIAFEFIESEE